MLHATLRASRYLRKRLNPCKIYFFNDFESDQSSGTHKPNLVVARWTCINCLDTPLNTSDKEGK